MAQEISDLPSYTRSVWLNDSLRTSDLVLVGRPVPDRDRLVVKEVLRGKVERSLVDKRGVMIDPGRFDRGGSGVWMLIRTPNAYYNINPEEEPLPLAEWERFGKATQETLALTDHRSANQIYRTYQQGKEEVWHGANVHKKGSELFVELFEHGDRIAGRAWDRQGRLERVYHLPKQGPGFFLQYRKGEVWRYAHYRGRKKVGVEREYHRAGPMKEESHWRDGIRHGRTRTFDENGKVVSDLLYDEGFIAPIIRYRGKKKGATVKKTEFGVVYSAPQELIKKIKKGMTVGQISLLLAEDFSEGTGLRFIGFTCEKDFMVRFERGHVVSAGPVHTGRHCQ